MAFNLDVYNLGSSLLRRVLHPKFWIRLRSMNEDLLLIKRLESLRLEHRDLDDRIKTNGLDEFTRKRLQKMKLFLRDEIMKLEQIVYPDIIA